MLPPFTRARMSIMRMPASSWRASVAPLSPKFSWVCVSAPPRIDIVSCVPGMDSADRLVESGTDRIQSGLLAVLSVRDTGDGIPLGQIDKIFEPFYTTKRENGSGLGLTIVDSIVKQHKGFVEVDSDPRAGTNFRLFFPLAPESAAPVDTLPALIRDEDGVITEATADLPFPANERFTNFGASGVLLYALVTGLLLGWMFRKTESQAHAT